jgi:hypothetical protein
LRYCKTSMLRTKSFTPARIVRAAKAQGTFYCTS